MISAGGVSFAYDGDGNRISKGSTYFVNDVNMPLTQALLEQDESGNTLASYTYGLELISMTKGNATYYYIYDGLGNVVAVTDEAGQTVQTYDYDAFGNVIQTSGTLENPYQFIGAYGCQDDGIGLIYMRARHYMPVTSRFTSRDPWWGNAYHPQSLNRYVYVQNNPINLVDPSGEGVGAIIFVASSAAYVIGMNQASDIAQLAIDCFEQLKYAKKLQTSLAEKYPCKKEALGRLAKNIKRLEQDCMRLYEQARHAGLAETFINVLTLIPIFR